ncbi:HTH_Tnp_Tc3_2 domain-containing protein [Trichonephila clavipes]|nr:HTH_Tnp_Tc3_2 domain-containing protein [Trichonephila clavipes]
MSFIRRPGSGCPRQTSRRDDHYIVINARVQPTASSAAIQTQVAPSLGASVSSRTIRRRLAEGHMDIAAAIMCSANDTHPPTPTLGVESRVTGLVFNDVQPSCLQ